jgi:hypothetical protein
VLRQAEDELELKVLLDTVALELEDKEVVMETLELAELVGAELVETELVTEVEMLEAEEL